MAGRSEDAPYRRAWNAGRMGQALPEGLASRATDDPTIDQMHDAGRNGVDYDQAFQELVPGEPASPSPSSSPFRSSSAKSPTEAGAGFLLGAVAYALVMSWIRHGPTGPVLWLKAKFLNETTPTTKTVTV